LGKPSFVAMWVNSKTKLARTRPRLQPSRPRPRHRKNCLKTVLRQECSHFRTYRIFWRRQELIKLDDDTSNISSVIALTNKHARTDTFETYYLRSVIVIAGAAAEVSVLGSTGMTVRGTWGQKIKMKLNAIRERPAGTGMACCRLNCVWPFVYQPCVWRFSCIVKEIPSLGVT